MVVRSVYLAMSKAFDKVWHEGLIFKLKQNGIVDKLLVLLKNYLSKRKKRTLVNGSQSSWSYVQSGVPQGSILGPLRFLFFFVHDTPLFSTVRDPMVSAEEFNQDLAIISKWAHQWKMSFNPDPTKHRRKYLFRANVTVVITSECSSITLR